MANEPDEHKDPQIPPVFNDEDTRKRIDKHLSDPNSKITEEDIRNISTEPNERYKIDPESIGADEEDGKNAEEKSGESEKKNDTDPAPPTTPWDVLGPH